jgi:hypothetical protein
MKTSKRAWVIWSIASFISLCIVLGSYHIHQPIYQVISSIFIFVPVFVALAVSDSHKKRK